eukprot:6206902-Pleurochrysis_carterae.AAC.1
MRDPGSLVVAPDASGVDGVGGYSFTATDSGEAAAWLVSKGCWPDDACKALRRGAATAEDRAAERASMQAEAVPPVLPLPTAELFDSWAVAQAVSVATSSTPRAAIAVGDCDPVAAAVNAASSAVGRRPCAYCFDTRGV